MSLLVFWGKAKHFGGISGTLLHTFISLMHQVVPQSTCAAYVLNLCRFPLLVDETRPRKLIRRYP